MAKVLIVDDNAANRSLIVTLLHHLGHQPLEAADGAEALQLARKERPQLVISDILMPAMDGFEFVRQLRADALLSSTQVVFCTAHYHEREAKNLAAVCGVSRVLIKPCEPETLLRVIEAELCFQSPASALPAAEDFDRDHLRLITDKLSEKAQELWTANVQLTEEIAERRRAEEAALADQKRLRAQMARLELLNRITRAVGERQDERSIFQAVVRSLEDQLPVDFCCVGMHDATDNVLVIGSTGIKSEALAKQLAMGDAARVTIDGNGLSRGMRGELFYDSDITHISMPFFQRLAQAGLRALVAVPLRVESKVFGMLMAARREAGSFSSEECEFLRQVSEHVALAAHQAHLYSALEKAYDDLRQTQQAVMQQERLRCLGQMASGIAHDINNAISPVTLYAESLLHREPNLSEVARDQLSTILRCMEDVTQTVGRLREFYRQREMQLTLTPVDLNALIGQVVEMTRARWSDMPQQRGVVVELHRDLAQELPAVLGVESELREALTNLVFNAVDAMPDGGALTLRTRTVPPSQVELEVADTGIGMNEETRRRCLEPFFTTKGERGSGLGLAMVYGIVQRHGAELEIDSVPGRGTVFRLIFSVPSQAAVTYSGPAEAEPGTLSRLRLLIVDDDPMLIRSLCEILEGDGHIVTTATGGQAGIDAFQKALTEGEPFAIVITDLGMPHVDGRQVASAIKAVSPSTPVIMLSGWGQRLIAEGNIPPHVDLVLCKPPRMRELKTALIQCSRKRGVED